MNRNTLYLVAIACAATVLIAQPSNQPDSQPGGSGYRVFLRGQSSPVVASNVMVTSKGVRITSASGQQSLSWARVRRIEARAGELSDTELALIDAHAEPVWRALTRFNRGDLVLAEPMLESLFVQYAGETGPTAIDVCRALTFCRLARGARASAIAPWLCWQAARPEEETFDLNPALPPIFLDTPSVRVFASRGVEIPGAAPISETASEIAAWYKAAAQHAIGDTVQYPEPPASQPAKFIAHIVLATSDDTSVRNQARARLDESIERESGDWSEAWARLAMGRSLTREPAREKQLEGLIQLSHLPARFASRYPDLAWLALAEMAAAFERLGRPTDAAIMTAEMRVLFPSRVIVLPRHPDWFLPASPAAPKEYPDA